MFSRQRQKVNFSRLPVLWLHPACVPHAEDRCSVEARCLQHCALGAAGQAEQKDFPRRDATLWSVLHPMSPTARPASPLPPLGSLQLLPMRVPQRCTRHLGMRSACMAPPARASQPQERVLRTREAK